MSIHSSEFKTTADADTRSDGAISIIPLNQEAWPTDYFSKELRLMAATVTRLELWDWFRIESPPEDTGYSWWNHPNINKISDNLQDDQGNFDNPHSGASFACSMRNMQAIAKEGFPVWKAQYIKNSN
jgi:hypothetical protein